MSYTEQEEFDVLHGLRIKGMAQPADIAAATGLAEDIVRAVVDDAVETQRARCRTGGHLQGYMLTSAGRDRHTELRPGQVPADLAGVAAAYEDFLAPNRAFKALITRWQTDGGGDVAAFLPELRAVHDDVTAVVTGASGTIPRMKGYEQRFGDALAAFAGGATSALAKPLSGSYHDIWMELHEDLLLTLGRERSDSDE